jgi:hypothetical protein
MACGGCKRRRIRFQQRLADQKLAELKKMNGTDKTPRQKRIEARNERIRQRNLRAQNRRK